MSWRLSPILISATAKESAEQTIRQWSPNNVADFLRRIGLGDYASKFQDEEVDGSTLLMASKDTFEELGVKSTLERVRVFFFYNSFNKQLGHTIAEKLILSVPYS